MKKRKTIRLASAALVTIATGAFLFFNRSPSQPEHRFPTRPQAPAEFSRNIVQQGTTNELHDETNSVIINNDSADNASIISGKSAGVIPKRKPIEVRKLEIRRSLEITYAPLFRLLKLSAGEVEAMKDVLVQRELDITERLDEVQINTGSRPADLRESQKYIEPINRKAVLASKKLLDDQGTTIFEDYLRTIRLRGYLGFLDISLGETPYRLLDEQREHLVAILHSDSFSFSPTPTITEEQMQLAREFLSSEQAAGLENFKTFLDLRKESSIGRPGS